MNLYRVFAFDAGAAPTDKGGALFVPPPSSFGRIDNPDRYSVLYLAVDPRAAVAESFGRFAIWQRTTFVHGSGLPYALASYTIPDTRKFFNLNDIDALKSIGITHPADVVTQIARKRQAWARDTSRPAHTSVLAGGAPTNPTGR